MSNNKKPKIISLKVQFIIFISIIVVTAFFLSLSAFFINYKLVNDANSTSSNKFLNEIKDITGRSKTYLLKHVVTGYLHDFTNVVDNYFIYSDSILKNLCQSIKVNRLDTIKDNLNILYTNSKLNNTFVFYFDYTGKYLYEPANSKLSDYYLSKLKLISPQMPGLDDQGIKFKKIDSQNMFILYKDKAKKILLGEVVNFNDFYQKYYKEYEYEQFQGLFYVFNDKGTLIFEKQTKENDHINKAFIKKKSIIDSNKDFNKALKNIIGSKSNGFVNIELNGAPCYIFYSYVKIIDNYFINIISTPKINEFFVEIKKSALHYFEELNLNNDTTGNVRLIFIVTAHIILLLILLYLTNIFSNRLIAPISRIINVMKIIGKGNFKHKILIKRRDEIGELADNFNLMSQDIRKYIYKYKSTLRYKEQILADLRVAAKIQNSFLPDPDKKLNDYSCLNFDIYSFFAPAKHVSGDFIDYFFIDDDRLFFVVGDVSGKGIPAAIFMSVVITLLKNYALSCKSCSEIIYSLNNSLSINNYTCTFATLTCCILNTRTGLIDICNAGHTRPAFDLNGIYKFIDLPKNPMVGIENNIAYYSKEYRLESDNVIFLYSDGIIDFKYDDDKVFDENALLQLLNVRENLDVKSLVNSMKTQVISLQHSDEIFDDISILAVKYGRKN